MDFPGPKELLRRAAEAQDQLAETLTKPVRDLASALGLPEPPEPPKAADLVESLPDLPTPEALLPGAEKEPEVFRMKTAEEGVKTRLRLKIV